MKKIILFLFFITFYSSCTSNEEGNIDKKTNDLERTALLTNLANNIIVPSYENYQSKVQVLATDITNFNSTPTEANLQTARNSWLEAYKAYQYITIYNFGKAEEIHIKETTNTFPTNAVGIEANIASGTYDFSLLSQFSKQGFPALDYLLNGLATTDAAIVEFYSANANATGYKQYLLAVANRLKSNAEAVATDWNTNYKASYIANNGTSVSSSLNIIANNFVKNLEKDIRTNKLGIPAGVFSNQTKLPEKVEGYYKKDVSKILLNEAIKASQDFFNGKHFGSATTSEGFKSRLDYLNIVRNGQKLSDIINNQFTTIYAANNALNNNFSEQVSSDNSKMLMAYDALQQNVVYTKLDMMQALNISIDYVDGDGD